MFPIDSKRLADKQKQALEILGEIQVKLQESFKNPLIVLFSKLREKFFILFCCKAPCKAPRAPIQQGAQIKANAGHGHLFFMCLSDQDPRYKSQPPFHVLLNYHSVRAC